MLVLEAEGPYLLFADDTDRVADFWQRALGLAPGHPVPSQASEDCVELVDDDRRVQIIVRRATPPRLRTRVNLQAFDTQDVAAAVERLVALGASSPRSTYPSPPHHAEVSDPAGNAITISAVIGPAQ